MKVLWFTNTPSLYPFNKDKHYGGGWISSLEEVMSRNDRISIGISFFHKEHCESITSGEVTYYPIKRKRNFFWGRLLKLINPTMQDRYDLLKFSEVVGHFRPDVIHVFGSEESFGLVKSITNVPVVIHLQGILSACLNAYYPPGISKLDFISVWHFGSFLRNLYLYRFFKSNSRREIKIFQNTEYFVGRTHWDRLICGLYAPRAKYFYCGEILRSQFYTAQNWEFHDREVMIITTTVSMVPYKGYDLILKTALLLKQYTSIPFVWNVYGVEGYEFIERQLSINAVDVNVYCKGLITAEALVNQLLDSDVFVHPSYIDNSPNSLCEAQYLGLPVISTDVGGISSLIRHLETGILVPANSPHILVDALRHVYVNQDFAMRIGATAREEAILRHDRKTIETELESIYQSLFCKNI